MIQNRQKDSTKLDMLNQSLFVTASSSLVTPSMGLKNTTNIGHNRNLPKQVLKPAMIMNADNNNRGSQISFNAYGRSNTIAASNS